MAAISYWAWLGTMYLIFLTYQDFKNDMWVDERKNYFMYGVTFSLLSHISRSLWYILLLAVLIAVFNHFGKKMDGFGEADIQSFNWIFFGFGLINPVWLGLFVIALAKITATYLIFKHKVFKIDKPTPYFAIILITFFVGCFWFQLYW